MMGPSAISVIKEKKKKSTTTVQYYSTTVLQYYSSTVLRHYSTNTVLSTKFLLLLPCLTAFSRDLLLGKGASHLQMVRRRRHVTHSAKIEKDTFAQRYRLYR